MQTRSTWLWLAALGMACIALSASPAQAQLGRQQGVLDPNVAAEKDLLAVPHMNAELVKALIEARPHKNIQELDKFLTGKSLTRTQLNDVYKKMFLHINLNAAPREEILLVPGMTNNMVREFLEYRPYPTYARFRTEIGKYVNATEVARLEQFTFIPVKLNAGTDDELKSIPGVTDEVLKAIKDQRPYNNIEKFREELGKKIDAKEVSRIERYVTVN